MNNFTKIIFIDNSIERCMKCEEIMKQYDTIIFDYECNYNEIDKINFDYYDICFYNVDNIDTIDNNFHLELLREHNTIFIATDNVLTVPEDEHHVKDIMNRGFDIMKEILSIYNLIASMNRPLKSLML
jgi:hypothetical protein